MSIVDAYIIVRDINPRGLPSLHRELLAGQPVLHRVIEKLKQIPSINEIAIICENIDPFLENCRDLYGVRLHNSTLDDIGRRDRFRRCRRWSVNGWRGGLRYSSVFDEDGWPSAFAVVHESHPCDLVYQVPAEYPFLDVALSEQIINHAKQVLSSAKVVFHQASPGLIGALYNPSTLLQMANGQLSLGDGLAVNNRGEENADEAIGPGNFDVSPLLSQNPWRFSADTPRQLKWLEELSKINSNTSAESWIESAKQQPFAPGPAREIEWEWAGPNMNFVSEQLFEEISAELLNHNDSLITVNGRGAWIEHPQWLSFCQSLMKRNCHGLHLRLDVKDLNETRVTQLLESQATVISFVFDEHHNNTELNVLVEDFCERNDYLTGSLVVVEMARTNELLDAWEFFWDKWFKIADQILWRYKDGLLLNRRFRAPCRKLFSELIIPWDGLISLCRETIGTENHLGQFPNTSIEQATKTVQQRWQQHLEKNYGEPCSSCDAWDRLTP